MNWLEAVLTIVIVCGTWHLLAKITIFLMRINEQLAIVIGQFLSNSKVEE